MTRAAKYFFTISLSVPFVVKNKIDAFVKRKLAKRKIIFLLILEDFYIRWLTNK